MATLKQRVGSALNEQLKKRDLQLVKNSELQDLLSESGRAGRVNGHVSSLPEGAVEYLQADNPRLLELKRRYRDHPASTHSQWQGDYLARELKLESFRGDGAFLYQGRLAGDPRYVLTTYYVKTIDKLNLLNSLHDDNLFGSQLVEVDGELLVSRDLLDSILELNFLEAELGLSRWQQPNILDIGAGYGRLAHRLASSLSNLGMMFCADAVPESTFLCEYYLKFRGVQDRAKTVLLGEIEAVLDANKIDLAVNIHSFAECTMTAIKWWLDQLQRHEVKYLFLVNERETLSSVEGVGDQWNFGLELQSRGYRLVSQQPKYGTATSIQKYGAFPAYYFLFELSK